LSLNCLRLSLFGHISQSESTRLSLNGLRLSLFGHISQSESTHG